MKDIKGRFVYLNGDHGYFDILNVRQPRTVPKLFAKQVKFGFFSLNFEFHHVARCVADPPGEAELFGRVSRKKTEAHVLHPPRYRNRQTFLSHYSLLLSGKEIDYKRNENAQHDAGGDRNINPELIPAEFKVAGKAAYGKFVGHKKHEPQNEDNRSCDH
jgi:hypothetical protein